MARALLIVPPFLKYNSGPLLGPALLQSAARVQGHVCSILDLNAQYVQQQQQLQPYSKVALSILEQQSGTTTETRDGSRSKSFFVGDHGKPKEILAKMEYDFVQSYIVPHVLSSTNNKTKIKQRIRYAFFTHEELQHAASAMATSSFGAWVESQLLLHEASLSVLQQGPRPPNLVGLSLLHAGQVIPSIAISMVAQNLWPQTLIAFGGPHISGIGHQALQSDVEDRWFAADIFVTGHAEQTFIEILNGVALLKKNDTPSTTTNRRTPATTTTTVTTNNNNSKGTANTKDKSSLAAPVFIAPKPKYTTTSGVLHGKRTAAPMIPTFDDDPQYLDTYYDQPLTLPAQSALGCSFGRCAFCTYPAIEPVPTKLDLYASVGAVCEQAKDLGALLSIKDSLVTPSRLHDIGSCINDRVQWSACTKLSPKLLLLNESQKSLLHKLNCQGLMTLEVGLESILEETQQRIHKVQSVELFQDFLVTVKETPNNMAVVVNYMTGFPWEQSCEAKRQQANEKLEIVRAMVSQILGDDRGMVEHNIFELERMAPMARKPKLYGIDQVYAPWPWASVLEYKRNSE